VPTQPASRLKLKTRVFAMVVIVSNALGNFSLTWGMKHHAALTLSPLSYIQAIFSPWVSIGIILLILWLLSRMALLSWADLSYVLPVTSLGYAANAFMGRFFLHEQITPGRWLGIAMIVAGTTLVGLRQPHTSPAQSEPVPAQPPLTEESLGGKL
jgi:drug/metabolite transporter (DMT)-like permease